MNLGSLLCLIVLVVAGAVFLAFVFALAGISDIGRRPPRQPQTPLPHPEDHSEAALVELIRRGYTGEAIKRISAKEGISLEAAKALADALEATILDNLPLIADPRQGALQVDIGHVRRLLRQQGRHAAINYVAEKNGLTTEEATYYVALLEAEQSP